MSNTFDLTIKHNLEVGLTNAINQINHLNIAVLMACGYKESKLTECSAAVIEQLKNSLEMLSLIEPEGEQPNAEMYEALKDLTFTANKLWDEVKPIKDGPSMKVTHPIITQAEYVLGKYAPVTLSEASNHSFQQAVEITPEGEELTEEERDRIAEIMRGNNK